MPFEHGPTIAVTVFVELEPSFAHKGELKREAIDELVFEALLDRLCDMDIPGVQSFDGTEWRSA